MNQNVYGLRHLVTTVHVRLVLRENATIGCFPGTLRSLVVMVTLVVISMPTWVRVIKNPWAVV